MKVRMLTGMAGVEFSLSVGDLHDCAEDEADRLIAAGFAEPVSDEPPADTAVAKVKSKGRKAVEKAVALITGVEQRD